MYTAIMTNLRSLWKRFTLVVLLPSLVTSTVKGSLRHDQAGAKILPQEIDTTEGKGKKDKKDGSRKHHIGDVVDDLDLGIRFNKVGANSSMGLAEYPLSMPTAQWLRASTTAISVIHPDDCQECPPDSSFFEDLVRSIGGEPTHPSRDEHSPYWQELREVVQVQLQRRNNIDPNKLLQMPNIWKDYDIHQVAKAVHNEFPGTHHIALMQDLLAQGATVNRDMVPSNCRHDFVRGAVMLSDLNGYAIRTVSPLNFGAKWWVGRARPEEVAFMIATGDLTSDEHGVPEDIVADIDSMKLSSPYEFTAYPEGSPTHPSWPAMHSAASSASLWLALVLNLTSDQLCEVKKVDFAISYARTVAGVHYPSDNMAGLNLGQEILSHYLPKYLSSTYGSKKKDVEDRVAKLRFDWNNFLSSDCIPNDWMAPSYTDR